MNLTQESPGTGHSSIAGNSREFELVVAGSGGDPCEQDLRRIRSTFVTQGNAKGIDWEEVLRLADHHGTSALLHQNLARCNDTVPAAVVPAAILASLQQRYEKNVHKSLFLARELIRVVDCMDSLGIEVIPYKGIVLAESYYGDMAMRQSGDMDLFVRPRDVSRIKNAVGDLGYTARVSIPEDAQEDYIASGYESTFDSSAGKNLLEIQWALQPRFYAVDYDMEGLFERAVSVTIAGRSMKTPGAEDLLLVLAVHAAKHVWGRLIWLCDIAQILKRKNLDWEWVRSRARRFGIERIVHVTLILAKRFLGMEIPSEVESAILADGAANVLAGEIAATIASEFSYPQVAYFRLMMRLRERRVDGLRFLTRLAFTPGPGEWAAVRLPKALFPFYRLVRMGRLAARFARG